MHFHRWKLLVGSARFPAGTASLPNARSPEHACGRSSQLLQVLQHHLLQWGGAMDPHTQPPFHLPTVLATWPSQPLCWPSRSHRAPQVPWPSCFLIGTSVHVFLHITISYDNASGWSCGSHFACTNNVHLHRVFPQCVPCLSQGHWRYLRPAAKSLVQRMSCGKKCAVFAALLEVKWTHEGPMNPHHMC